MTIKSIINIINPHTRQETLHWKHILGFYPNNLALYRTAVTHLSAQEKDQHGKRINNERLEFLGDAFLGITIASLLYRLYPNATEGFLTRTRSKIVCRQHLNEVCIRIGLNKMLHVSHALKANAQNIFGNAIEALVGAIYIDQGVKKAEKWIVKHIANIDTNNNLDNVVNEETDFKSHIYEWAQHNKKYITFDLIQHEYSPHIDQHTYTYQLSIDGEIFAIGKGNNKRQAQQKASKRALEKLKKHNK